MKKEQLNFPERTESKLKNRIKLSGKNTTQVERQN
jgi:hypothetical protein